MEMFTEVPAGPLRPHGELHRHHAGGQHRRHLPHRRAPACRCTATTGSTTRPTSPANVGGAIADTTWLEPGDVPMVAFHTVFDPRALHLAGRGDSHHGRPGGTRWKVPPPDAPGEQYGNNASFANLVSDPRPTAPARSTGHQDACRRQCGHQLERGGPVPFVTMDWPGMMVVALRGGQPLAVLGPMSPWPRRGGRRACPSPPTRPAWRATRNMSPGQGPRLHRHHHGLHLNRASCALQLGPARWWASMRTTRCRPRRGRVPEPLPWTR